MGKRSREAQVGDKVWTDYTGKMTEHEITERQESSPRVSQSGVMFAVRPIVPKSSGGLLDADWFEVMS